MSWNRSGFRAVAIHGGKNQESRQRALRDFREVDFPFLWLPMLRVVIDVPNVKHVVNYDMPNSIEKYTHRIGRTGRAGKTGMSTTFLTDHDEEVMYDLATSSPSGILELEKNPRANQKNFVPDKKKKRKWWCVS